MISSLTSSADLIRHIRYRIHPDHAFGLDTAWEIDVGGSFDLDIAWHRGCRSRRDMGPEIVEQYLV